MKQKNTFHPALRIIHWLMAAYPPGSVRPLTPIVIWTAPEIVRFPALITRGEPLRIRSVRLINKAGYRRRGMSENDVTYIAPSH